MHVKKYENRRGYQKAMKEALIEKVRSPVRLVEHAEFCGRVTRSQTTLKSNQAVVENENCKSNCEQAKSNAKSKISSREMKKKKNSVRRSMRLHEKK